MVTAAAPTGGLPTFVPVMVTPEPNMVEPSVLPSATSPPATPTAVAGAVLEVMLPNGARVRLEGAVDPALAAAVLGALATSGRAS
jgi:transposase